MLHSKYVFGVHLDPEQQQRLGRVKWCALEKFLAGELQLILDLVMALILDLTMDFTMDLCS